MVDLEPRTKGFGLFRLTEYDGAKIPADFPISEATSVVLHLQGKSIVLTNIELSDNGSFTGRVLAIEPPGTTLIGVSEGERIAFEEQHVVSMGK